MSRVRAMTAKQVKAWERRCKFKEHKEAFEPLGVTERTWYRWRAYGLPLGQVGVLFAEKMKEIETSRKVLPDTLTCAIS